MRKYAIAGLLALVLALSACGNVPGTDDYNDKHGQGDAGVGHRDDSDADVVNMPDGFSNVATKCDGEGHRIFVTTQNASGKFMVVVNDENCR